MKIIVIFTVSIFSYGCGAASSSVKEDLEYLGQNNEYIAADELLETVKSGSNVQIRDE